MRYILDTDVISQLSKERPHAAAYAWIQSQEDDDIFISAATLFEIRFGVSARDQEELYAWMDERYARARDAKLEQALKSGGMDERIRRALASRRLQTCAVGRE